MPPLSPSDPPQFPGRSQSARLLWKLNYPAAALYSGSFKTLISTQIIFSCFPAACRRINRYFHSVVRTKDHDSSGGNAPTRPKKEDHPRDAWQKRRGHGTIKPVCPLEFLILITDRPRLSCPPYNSVTQRSPRKLPKSKIMQILVRDSLAENINSTGRGNRIRRWNKTRRMK